MVRVTLCVILKMFERHLATFKWQKLSEIDELEKQSMTFSICVFGLKNYVDFSLIHTQHPHSLRLSFVKVVFLQYLG